jgi:hypothetical protein
LRGRRRRRGPLLSGVRIFFARLRWTLLAKIGSRDGAFDQQVVRSADQQKMFHIVSTYDDELTVAPKLKGVDHVHAALAAAGTRRRPYPLSEQKTEDVENKQGGE